MLTGLCNSKLFPSSVATNLQPGPAKYDSETLEYSLFFHLHWLVAAITLLDFSAHIQPIFLSTFLISAIHPSHCRQKTVLKLLVIYIKINNYSPSKNKMHFSSHGTQNIKIWSLLFFFFSICILYCYSILHHPTTPSSFPVWGLDISQLSVDNSAMRLCNLDVSWYLPTLRYFGRFIIVLNYLLLSVKRSNLSTTLRSGLAMWLVWPTKCEQK